MPEGVKEGYPTLDKLVPTNEAEIDFDKAIFLSTEIAKSQSLNQMWLGEIGAKTSGKTLSELAQASGIPYASFKCYVAAWRAYGCPVSQIFEMAVGNWV